MTAGFSLISFSPAPSRFSYKSATINKAAALIALLLGIISRSRNVGGEHPAYSIITKQFHSATCGHIHTFDYAIRTSAIGKKIHGLVAGVYQDYQSPWAGEVNQLWNRGLVIKRGVENGSYDLEWVGINRLKEIYGK